MKVTVLLGGPSAEREVSLVSGNAVIDGLRAAGHEVTPADIAPDNLDALSLEADVIFPVLHGIFGESGELQHIMERRELCFVGSGSVASRTGIDKIRSKEAFESAKLPAPAHNAVTYRDYNPARPLPFDAPCVVKAIDSGSSIDVFVCKTEEEARTAISDLLKRHSRCMIEQFISGAEVTVGILHDQALAPIRITTTREFFDFDAKYRGNFATHDFDLGLPADVRETLQQTALAAHQAVGCRDLSRVDMIVDADMKPWILELNTMPGFTPKSLLPEAAKHDGVEFSTLVDRLVSAAWERHHKTDAPSTETPMASAA